MKYEAQDNVDLKGYAIALRHLADMVEANEIGIIGIVTSDHEGRGGVSCYIDHGIGGEKLIHEMVDGLRDALFQTFQWREFQH